MAFEYRHVLNVSGPIKERDAFRTAHLLSSPRPGIVPQTVFDWSGLLPVPEELRSGREETEQDGYDLYFGEDDARLEARKRLAALLPDGAALTDLAFGDELKRVAPELFATAQRLREIKDRHGVTGREEWIALHWGSGLPFETQTDLQEESLMIYFRTEDRIPVPILTLLSRTYPLLHFDLEWIEEVEMTSGRVVATGGTVMEVDEKLENS